MYNNGKTGGNMKQGKEVKNNSDFVELTSQSYLEITETITKEVTQTSDSVNKLNINFKDKQREIYVAQKELNALKKKLVRLKKERKSIKCKLVSNKRSIKVNADFLNRLNKCMINGTETHLVNVKTKRIKKI